MIDSNFFPNFLCKFDENKNHLCLVPPPSLAKWRSFWGGLDNVEYGIYVYIYIYIYIYEEGAVLYAGFEKTLVSFTNWVFQNNSAVQGTIFVIESESFVNWTNCTFINNFSITSTIFMTSLNGYFEFYNSSIYNNYATNCSSMYIL